MRLPFKQIDSLLENKQYPKIALPREVVRVLWCLVRGCVPFQSNLPGCDEACFALMLADLQGWLLGERRQALKPACKPASPSCRRPTQA